MEIPPFFVFLRENPTEFVTALALRTHVTPLGMLCNLSFLKKKIFVNLGGEIAHSAIFRVLPVPSFERATTLVSGFKSEESFMCARISCADSSLNRELRVLEPCNVSKESLLEKNPLEGPLGEGFRRRARLQRLSEKGRETL